MSEWHDSSCRRLDMFTSGGISVCLSCGSVQPEPDPSSPDDENTHDNIYKPLENITDMRLLTLEPGGYDDPVCGILNLTTTSGFLEYDAISYTWAGEDENMDRSGHITLNSQGFAVTQNCEAALRRARSRSGPKAVWIDAICINQEDIRERGHQVRLMQQIYSRADSVLIYLGEPSREEDELLAFISDQDELLSRDRGLLQRLRKALSQLFKRRYFSRVWVLQEVALARRAILLCGKHSISWSLTEIQRLDRIGLLEYSTSPGRRPILPGLDRLPPILEFRAPAFRDPSKLLQLLDITRGSQASDPRDKVFALLGLLTCPESDGLVADYTKSTADIYASIAIWIAQRFGLPELLSRSRVLQKTLPVEYQGPQWAPYWASDDFQQLTSGLGGRRPVGFDEEPTETLAGRLPVIVCERDMFSIKFPALLLGTTAEVLRHLNSYCCSVFDSVPCPEDHDIVSTEKDGVDFVFDPDAKIGAAKYLKVFTGRYIHLNHRVTIQKTDDGKTYRSIPPSPSETVEDSLAAKTWIRDLIYLIPEPRQDEFQFTEPGFVSVNDSHTQDIKVWTHTNERRNVTTGMFSNYAVCCSEHYEGNDTRIYLRGLWEHRMTRNMLGLEATKFEFVSAR
ncbi:heterokaryon incompatibility protein [Colletotrichum kahawae]|uniref:Heterokaryon incompatibility protein n=1 Tax=Colletotrichum kahawae TaxID=34407 RepID=A0AAD9YFQ6_COLKA|nr:heterokaryon incompatibility protein [Colletotrichum kahawae]